MEVDIQQQAEEEDQPGPSSPAGRPCCEVCQQQPAKYCCPGCRRRTCSLPCANRHKQESGCSGKRNAQEFVSLQQFGDRELLSDYRFLEEVGRRNDVAARCEPPRPAAQLPQHLSVLVSQARRRGVTLLLMAPGMQRRRSNSTRFDRRGNKMSWKVEWHFPSAAAAAPDAAAAPAAASGGEGGSTALQAPAVAQPAVVDPRVDEDATLGVVLAAHLTYKPGAAARSFALRRYADAGLPGLRVVMRKERCPANAPAYHEIDLSSSLRVQLAGTTVVENPVLVVLLAEELTPLAYPIAPREPFTAPPPPPQQQQQRQQQQQQQQRQQHQQQQRQQQQQRSQQAAAAAASGVAAPPPGVDDAEQQAVADWPTGEPSGLDAEQQQAAERSKRRRAEELSAQEGE